MKIVVGNWKMNVGVRESVALARGTLLALRGRKVIPELVLCPPFVAISEVRKIVARSASSLGAQNMSWESQGAFTGEISSRMLVELGVSHVILGHSERRAIFGETDEQINKKVLKAFDDDLIPILCIGETQEQRNNGMWQDVVKHQLTQDLAGARLQSNARLLIAYEPIWAIGTGNTPEIAQIIEIHSFIRSLVAEIFPKADSKQVSVLYGGSVVTKNAYGFLREETVDGVLVGTESVKVNHFNEIISAAAEVLEAQM